MRKYEELFEEIKYCCKIYNVDITSYGKRHTKNITMTYKNMKLLFFINTTSIDKVLYMAFQRNEFKVLLNRNEIMRVCALIIQLHTLYESYKLSYITNIEDRAIVVKNYDNKLLFQIMIQDNFRFVLLDYTTYITYNDIEYKDIIIKTIEH